MEGNDFQPTIKKASVVWGEEIKNETKIEGRVYISSKIQKLTNKREKNKTD